MSNNDTALDLFMFALLGAGTYLASKSINQTTVITRTKTITKYVDVNEWHGVLME